MQIPKIRKLITLLITFLLLLTFQYANAEPIHTKAMQIGKGDCGLTVQDPHISESLLKKKIKAIKINVTSTCIYPQEKVTVRVTLLRKGFFGWVEIPAEPSTISVPRPSPFKVEFKKIFFECKTNKRTKYWAKANSTAIIGGKVFKTPDIYSENTVTLKCGL